MLSRYFVVAALLGLAGCAAETEAPGPAPVVTEDGVSTRNCKDLVKTFDVENAGLTKVVGECLPGAGAGSNAGGASFGDPSNVPGGSTPNGPNSKGFQACTAVCEAKVDECLLSCAVNPNSTGRTLIGPGDLKMGNKVLSKENWIPSFTPGITGSAAHGMCVAECARLRPACISGCVPILTGGCPAGSICP